jgi:Ribbon-helix-helix protein, copG family
MEQTRKVVTSLTIDPALVYRLDQAAADLDRSRSWLASRAIETFLRSAGGGAPITPTQAVPSPLGGSEGPAMPGPPTCVPGRDAFVSLTKVPAR